jgi:AAA domain/UvrD-like helicase C-terminal domain
MLTKDQQAAFNLFFQFLADPQEQVFVLEGYAGCGKTFLVKELLQNIDKFFETQKLVNPEFKIPEVELTATTNKAAEALFEQVQIPVKTVYSLLGLRVDTDFSTGKSTITLKYGAPKIYDSIIFIDEASYADRHLIKYVFSQTQNCKIVFIGDPAQLTMGNTASPVFTQNWVTAKLTEVVRQAKGSPIIELATQFRNTVNDDIWRSIKPDNKNIIKLSKQEMLDELEKEFTRPNWHFKDSKVLAWTNKTVIAYNHYIRELVKSTPELCEGDYATVNNYISITGKGSLKTDQTVLITQIQNNITNYGVEGKLFFCDTNGPFFMPNNLADKNELLKQAKKNSQTFLIAHIEKTWIDLRATYACTVNKSQGSTYDKVFVDLKDISKCNSGNQIARMLYVACSRPKTTLYLYGDSV